MRLEVATLLKAASFSACGVGMDSSKLLGIHFLSGLRKKTRTWVLGIETKGFKVLPHLPHYKPSIILISK